MSTLTSNVYKSFKKANTFAVRHQNDEVGLEVSFYMIPKNF